MAKSRRRRRSNRRGSMVSKTKVKKALPIIATGLATGGLLAIGYDTYKTSKGSV